VTDQLRSIDEIFTELWKNNDTPTPHGALALRPPDYESSLIKPQGEKEPHAEPQRQLTAFEKTAVKALIEKTELSKQDKDEDVAALIASLQSIATTRIKTVKLKKVSEETQRFGILDSGATHNVRELKEEEDY
jgi:hypothetical protein